MMVPLRTHEALDAALENTPGTTKPRLQCRKAFSLAFCRKSHSPRDLRTFQTVVKPYYHQQASYATSPRACFGHQNLGVHDPANPDGVDIRNLGACTRLKSDMAVSHLFDTSRTNGVSPRRASKRRSTSSRTTQRHKLSPRGDSMIRQEVVCAGV